MNSLCTFFCLRHIIQLHQSTLWRVPVYKLSTTPTHSNPRALSADLKLDLLLFRNTIISDNKTVAELTEMEAWILVGIGSTKNIVPLPLEEAKDKRRVKCRWMLIRHRLLGFSCSAIRFYLFDTKFRLNLLFVMYLVGPLAITRQPKNTSLNGCFVRFLLSPLCTLLWLSVFCILIRFKFPETDIFFRNSIFFNTIRRMVNNI